MPNMQTQLVEANDDVKIISFDVFNHYLAILQERNGIREMVTINLTTNK